MGRKAYEDLLLSLDAKDLETFAVINEAKTVDLLNSYAALAWKNLQDKFRLATGAAKVELKLEFQTKKLESAGEHPETQFSELLHRKE